MAEITKELPKLTTSKTFTTFSSDTVLASSPFTLTAKSHIGPTNSEHGEQYRAEIYWTNSNMLHRKKQTIKLSLIVFKCILVNIQDIM